MKENSKNVWTLVLTIAKYAITLAIGFIGGDSGVLNDLM